MDDHIEETTPVEYLTECLTTFVQEATGSVEKFWLPILRKMLKQ